MWVSLIGAQNNETTWPDLLTTITCYP